MITFEQFQNGKLFFDAVTDHNITGHGEPIAAFVYPGGLLYIELCKDHPGACMLTIGNDSQISGDLSKLERILYDYGVSEGAID